MKYGLDHTISLMIAQCWMKDMQYYWMKDPSDQYIDGHEWDNIVRYWQDGFLPMMAALKKYLWKWIDGIENIQNQKALNYILQFVIIWFYNKSVFYVHDCRKSHWVYRDKMVMPKSKGEDASLIIADFISADYRWLHSPDRTKHAHEYFKLDKNWDRWFTNEDILDQATNAIDVLKRYYPNERHILVFDNVITYLKCSLTAPSVIQCQKIWTSREIRCLK